MRTLTFATLAVAFLFLAGCASSVPPDPTPEHPRVGCLAATLNQQARAAGKLLPDPVRIIGITSLEDGERWKVLLPGVYDPSKWVPIAQETVKFVGCGPAAEGVAEVLRRP